MTNSLLIRTGAHDTFNFLIFLQNIFLNQSQNDGQLRFPYFPAKMSFKGDFTSKYRELWNEVSQKIYSDEANDLTVFYEEKEEFYQRLFEESDDSLIAFNEAYTTFQVWWDSLAGRFSVENSLVDMVENLYYELTNYLKNSGIEPKGQLDISLIYDECLLAKADTPSYFAVIPIKDFLVNARR